jgi:hypothetical protein
MRSKNGMTKRHDEAFPIFSEADRGRRAFPVSRSTFLVKNTRFHTIAFRAAPPENQRCKVSEVGQVSKVSTSGRSPAAGSSDLLWGS